MRWLLATVMLLLPLSSARAGEPPLPGRFLDQALAGLPAPQPISFDLVDLREEERAEARAVLAPPKSDATPHSFFVIKQHIGIAGGYDNGSPHGSIGFYITVAEWKRWNLGVPSIEVGVGRYPAYDARLNQAFIEGRVRILRQHGVGALPRRLHPAVGRPLVRESRAGVRRAREPRRIAAWDLVQQEVTSTPRARCSPGICTRRRSCRRRR